MAATVDKLSVRARTGQSGTRVLLVFVFFAALLGSAALVGYKLIKPVKPIPRDQYRGVVQLAPDDRGQCQRFDFDNQTGKMRLQGETLCSDESLISPGPNPSFGPLGGVRDYFRSR
jgi:hypothetical protein